MAEWLRQAFDPLRWGAKRWSADGMRLDVKKLRYESVPDIQVFNQRGRHLGDRDYLTRLIVGGAIRGLRIPGSSRWEAVPRIVPQEPTGVPQAPNGVPAAFMDRYRRGAALPGQIDDEVDRWHDAPAPGASRCRYTPVSG